MSVSKWAYDPEMCNDQICPGDCEFCRIWLDREDEDSEKEYKDEVYYRKDMAIEAAEKANVKENAERFWRGCN